MKHAGRAGRWAGVCALVAAGTTTWAGPTAAADTVPGANRVDASDARPGASIQAAPLAPVMITATRGAVEAATASVSVSVLQAADWHETVATNFRELFRYEPGLVVKREPRGRGGEAGIELRGIGGQRLALLVDGVRLPNGYAAAGANMGQLKLDPASLSRVEVLRGPASSLYGSDALAGVVLFRTLSPSDFLDEGKTLGGSAEAGYDSLDHGRYSNANLAFAAGPTQNLISVTRRRGHEVDNHDAPLIVNPQDTDTENLLIKSALDLSSGHSLTLTGEYFRQRIDTSQLSLVGPITGGGRLTDSTAQDESSRARLGAAYRYRSQGGWFDSFSAQVDYQDSRDDEHTGERRSLTTGVMTRREGLLSYREPQWSGSAQFEGSLATGAVGHRWVAGADLVSKSVSVHNDATEYTVNRNIAPSKIVDGETYPRAIAPDTDIDNLGVFFQDEMSFGERLKITPSLRFDTYKLSPSPDTLFARANTAGITPVGLSRNAWTPRLGASYAWQARQAVFANLVTGFRMPTYNQLNRIGQVPVATFIHDFIPAPGLKPERSRGVELGARGAGEIGSYELTGFYNRYTDFIDTPMIAYIAPSAGNARAIRRFQSRNIGSVDIYGVEARGRLALRPLLGTQDDWSIVGAAQWSMGTDKTSDQPINSIQPAKLVLGLRWDNRGGVYGGQVSGNFVRAKERVNRQLTQTGSTAPVPLETGGYATLDASAYYRVSKQVTVHLAMFNLLDKRYFDWSTVSSLSGNDARLLAYTAAGRTVSASVRMEF